MIEQIVMNTLISCLKKSLAWKIKVFPLAFWFYLIFRVWFIEKVWIRSSFIENFEEFKENEAKSKTRNDIEQKFPSFSSSKTHKVQRNFHLSPKLKFLIRLEIFSRRRLQKQFSEILLEKLHLSKRKSF